MTLHERQDIGLEGRAEWDVFCKITFFLFFPFFLSLVYGGHMFFTREIVLSKRRCSGILKSITVM